MVTRTGQRRRRVGVPEQRGGELLSVRRHRPPQVRCKLSETADEGDQLIFDAEVLPALRKLGVREVARRTGLSVGAVHAVLAGLRDLGVPPCGSTKSLPSAQRSPDGDRRP